MKNNTSHIPKIRFPEFSGGWEEKIFQDFSKINQGLQIAISNRFTEEIEWSYFYITNEFLREWSEKKYYIKNPPESVLCNKDDLLMTRTWNTWKVVTWVEWAFHNNFFKIKYDKNIVDKFFIYLFLTSTKTQNKILSLAGTSTIPDLNHGDFYKLKIFLPQLPEQQKIANFLSSVDKKIENIREKKKNLEEYKKGMMQKIFSQEIRFKDENGESFGEWEEKKLGEIASFSKWKFLSKSDIVSDWKYKCIHYWELFTKYWPKVKKILSTTNIEWNLVFSKWNEILMPTSDVTPNGLATWSAILDKNVILGWDILIINSNKIYNVFFAYYIMSHRKNIMKLVSWSTVYHLYWSDMSKLQISLPSLPEQQKIADFLSSLDEKIEKTSEELEKMEEFKKGLLQGMFV